jgi:hypothetical protein
VFKKAATAAERRERLEREQLMKKLEALEELEQAASKTAITWSPPRGKRRHEHGEDWHRDREQRCKQRREDCQRAREFLLDWQEGLCTHCGAEILWWTGTKIRLDSSDGLEKLWCARCSTASTEMIFRTPELRRDGGPGENSQFPRVPETFASAKAYPKLA